MDSIESIDRGAPPRPPRRELICRPAPRRPQRIRSPPPRAPPAMNIHHLELFYYVATHGGISRAVRHMPYGIQQPAVSGQILQLEEELGTKLFARTPFKLTAPGEELYGAIAPFFSSLPGLRERVARQAVPRLAIGAAEFLLADHLPAVLARLRQRVPDFRLGLRSGYQAQFETWLLERQIDLALTPIERKPAGRVRQALLLRLPLALLVPKRSPWPDANTALTHEPARPPLITLPQTESVSRIFAAELRRRKQDWPPAIEASSLALLVKYVENGYGVGVTLQMPGVVLPRGLRLLPLVGFPPLELHALWLDDGSPLVQAALEELRAYAAKFGGPSPA